VQLTEKWGRVIFLTAVRRPRFINDEATNFAEGEELLGHRSSKTTEIYTHVSQKSLQNIKSTFDDL